ncbi:MAG: catabolite repression protein creC [Benniella sp.]|nr:MAG: catabolite repression protein creC [Benniella sp.]
MITITQDCQGFVATEGEYTLQQDIFLDQVPAHPVIPTYVSSVSVKYKDYQNSAGNGPPPLKDSTPIKEINHAQGTKSLGRAATFPMLHDISESSQGISSYATIGPSLAASVGLTSLFSGKRKKNNIAKTNSTFVAKITTNENLSKILANRVNEDVYVFWNTGKTFTWSELGQKPNEPLSHISFSKASPTSHDVNVLTRSCDHLDVIIGFSTGDIIWFNPLSNKYCRLNKQAIIKDSAVTMIRWLPGSESQFMASFQDGTIVVMDKDRDDNTFSVSIPPHENGFHPTKPKNGRHNPVSHWHIGRKPVTAFAFSPDLQHTAVVAMDGGLRIIDFRNERLIDTFQSYFGALNCVCWSPDGRYILTGGQDDLVTIWSFKDMKIVARCQGHQSYVTGVAFDPWRCDERNYRFGSVGEDAKLLLWDFSVGALHKPKAVTENSKGSEQQQQQQQQQQQGHALSSIFQSNRGQHPQQSQEVNSTQEPLARPPEPRARVAMLQPSLAVAIHQEPLASITFREDAIMTSDRRGHIKIWKRPSSSTSDTPASGTTTSGTSL